MSARNRKAPPLNIHDSYAGIEIQQETHLDSLNSASDSSTTNGFPTTRYRTRPTTPSSSARWTVAGANDDADRSHGNLQREHLNSVRIGYVR